MFRETKTALNLLKDTRGDARDKVKQIAARFPYEFVKQQTNPTESSTPASWNRSRANSQTLDVNIVSQEAYLVTKFFVHFWYVFQVKLHRKVINASQTYQRCQVQWRSLLELAFYLEDVNMAESLGKLPSKWTQLEAQNCSGKKARFSRNFHPLFEKLRFLWHVQLQRPVFQVFKFIFNY